jgi:hypothetical protein
VREEDGADAAQLLDAAHERAREARRVDEDVAAFAFRPDDEVTPRAEARLRGEAAEVDVGVDALGERLDALARVVISGGADGRGRAGDERHQRAPRLGGRGRLAEDARLFAVVAEDRGRYLPARVAVDARVVDVEVARHIFGQTPRRIRHAPILRLRVRKTQPQARRGSR